MDDEIYLANAVQCMQQIWKGVKSPNAPARHTFTITFTHSEDDMACTTTNGSGSNPKCSSSMTGGTPGWSNSSSSF